jgi:prepilin-type N-terminal cleavage/methylation domain-containing protein
VNSHFNPSFAVFTPRRENAAMKNNINRRHGFTLVEIMIVVAIIGLLASMAIPNLMRSRDTARTNTCINNLRCIDSAKSEWALELSKNNTDTPQPADLQPYLGRTTMGSLPSCPADPAHSFATSYSPQSVGVSPLCLVFPATHIMP